jgi:mannose-6-phosphate isomerase
MKEYRPWGYYEVLVDETDHKIKRITVYPKQRFSLQRHGWRDEHWFVLSGTANITVGTSEKSCAAGQSIDIPRKALHRLCNLGDIDVTFIEIQRGEYFGEDDIERLEDDYGRC